MNEESITYRHVVPSKVTDSTKLSNTSVRAWRSLPTSPSLTVGLLLAQTRERTVNAGRTPAIPGAAVVKVDVNLVMVDALVLQKNTARVVGNLKQDDLVILEDGTKQSITHFSRDRRFPQ